MSPRTEARRSAAVLFTVVAALAAAGCGGGAATTAPASTAPTAPPTTDPAAAARAGAAVLQPGDFPTGWKALLPEDGGGLGIDAVWQDITKCLGLVTPPPAGAATSPTFVRGLATQARSTVEYGSEASAASVASALAGPKFQGCAGAAFTADVKRSAPEGGIPGPVAVAPLALPSIAPAKTTTFRITVTINLGDLQVPLFQDFLVAYKGGAVIRMFFLNPGSEFPQDLERTLVDKVVGRA